MESDPRGQLIELLWRGHDPFFGYPANARPIDKQGWNSGHHYLEETISSLRPAITIEIGVWKGGSSITLAKALRKNQIKGVVLSIDTWLGSWEHWNHPSRFLDLKIDRGYPTLFHTFMSNVIGEGLQEYIVPLPIDSNNAFNILKKCGISAGVIHIDGGHDYKAVSDDLVSWWGILQVGGVIIGDDYDPARRVWPSVGAAIDDFCRGRADIRFESSPYKCRIRKLA